MLTLLEYARCGPASNWTMQQVVVFTLYLTGRETRGSAKVWRWLCPLLWDHKVSPWLSPSLSQLWLSCRRPQTQSPGLAHRALDRPVPAATLDSTAVGPAPKSEMKRNKAKPRNDNGAKKPKLLQRSWRRFDVGAPRPPTLFPVIWGRMSNIRTALLRTSSCRHLAPGPVVLLPAGAHAGPLGACSAETLTGRAAG